MFKDLFKSESQDKLTDKTFIRLIVTSILAITICIVCLCSSTWAWFNTSVSGGGNEIKAAGECLLEISVAERVEVGDNVTYIPLTDAQGIEITDYTVGVQLVTGKTYTVTLNLPDGATSSGYCLITVGGTAYNSEYIYREDAPKQIYFNLTVTEDKIVSFTPRWGIFLDEPFVKHGETAILP